MLGGTFSGLGGPVQAYIEPCFDSGKAVRWRIKHRDGKPFGLAGLWESRTTDSGDPS